MKRIKFTAIIAVVAIMVAVLLTGCGGSGGSESSGNDIDSAMKASAEYLVENVAVDSADSMGGGWIPFALKMSGTDAADEDYYMAYFDSIRLLAKSNKGVISKERPTANERVSINLKAIGQDPTNVEGFDLMKLVDDYETIKGQGLNAEIYALVSANYCGYTLKNEEQYLYDLIANQHADGAFGMDAEHPDSDMTAMAIQALAAYGEGGEKSDDRAQGAITRALEWLKSKQLDDGSFGNAESTSQVLIALGCLGRDGETDADFIKGDKSAVDGLMTFYMDGAFCHEADGEVDVMATEQALMALDAVKMAQAGQKMFG